MNLLDRVKNIITRPNLEWDIIDNEPANTNKILTQYVIPLAGAAAVAAFIGYAFIGLNVLGFRIKGIDWGLYQGLSVFISGILSVFVTAAVVDALAPSFDSQKNFPKSFQLVAYSFTPAWIGGLLAIFPSIALVGALFALYGLYLLYIGIPKLKRTSPEKHITYFAVTLIVTIVVYFVVNWILTKLLMNIFGLTYGNFVTTY